MTANEHNDEDAPPTRKLGGVEQHIHSILLAVITAVVLYSGTFVIGAREDSVRFTEKIGWLAAEVSGLRVQLMAHQNNTTTLEQYRDHEARIRAIEAESRASRRLGTQ